ncbi:MAG: extracellular solute-binding protein [Bacteroidetes bacterium]|nr:extracellular solute-binding protein [Bacteroidota bacterium]
MRHRAWLWGLWALALGCASDRPPPQKASAGPIELLYWCAPNPDEVAIARELVAAWNRRHPEVRVRLQPLPAGQSSEEVLLAAVAARTTPDVCSNIWPGIVPDLARAGALLALDAMPGFDSLVRSRLPEGMLEAFRSADGRVYQLPWKTNPILMQYNVRLLREAGFSRPPRTYSEYLEAAARLRRDLDGDGTPDRWMGFRDIRPIWWQRYFDFYAFYLAASGGRSLFDAQGRLVLDTAAAAKVLGFFQVLFERGYYPRSTLVGNAFLNGRIATEFTGPWILAYLEKYAPPDLEYDYAPLPVPDGHRGPVYTYGDHKNIAIFSTSRHPEAAWRFVQYLVSEEADRLLLLRAQQLPIRRGLLEDPDFVPIFARHPKLRRFAEQVPYSRAVDGVRDLKEILDAVARQFERASVYGRVSPQEAVRRLVARIRLIQEWAS